MHIIQRNKGLGNLSTQSKKSNWLRFHYFVVKPFRFRNNNRSQVVKRDVSCLVKELTLKGRLEHNENVYVLEVKAECRPRGIYGEPPVKAYLVSQAAFAQLYIFNDFVNAPPPPSTLPLRPSFAVLIFASVHGYHNNKLIKDNGVNSCLNI